MLELQLMVLIFIKFGQQDRLISIRPTKNMSPKKRRQFFFKIYLHFKSNQYLVYKDYKIMSEMFSFYEILKKRLKFHLMMYSFFDFM